MTKIKEWIADRPYAVAGGIFLGLAIIGVKFLGWWQDELELLLILYVIVILGIRLDDISRKIGNPKTPAAPQPEETETIMAKLDEIVNSLKLLNHQLAKLTMTRQRPAPAADSKKNPQQKLPTETNDPNT